tara:strand:- start:725 stop:925 length:201 start_codon:yes stop_codon:yes gene_type:complete
MSDTNPNPNRAAKKYVISLPKADKVYDLLLKQNLVSPVENDDRAFEDFWRTPLGAGGLFTLSPSFI